MDRPGVRQVPEGSGEQRKMEDTGCEVICGAHMTLAVKALVKVKGGQHHGKYRPGVRQVPEGSGEQRKMEETGCEIICGAPTTFVVKG